MRETQFIKQNQEKWAEFEEALDGKAKNADRLRDLFVQITDDLSYSRTFYPNRSVRVYLNGLAQRVFTQLYRSKRSSLGVLASFWTIELPLEVYNARRSFYLALLLFALSFGIGMLSSAMDPEFAEVILGDSYVEMTRANIESGDPMAVYKEKGRFDMFLGITFNNVYVAFLAFCMGVFLGIGSIVILIGNAVMVGCFQYFFIEQGLFWDSFLTIWIHGTLEISAIVIATAAGITMGQGPAFPGTLTRLQAFQQSAHRGAKIMLGTVPLFIVAGFLEGYLTRQTELSPYFRGAFILACLLFVLIYFWWYPWFLYKNMGVRLSGIEERKLPETEAYQLDTSVIKSNGAILSEAFTLFRKNSSLLLTAIFTSALVYVLLIFGLSNSPPAEMFPFQMDSIFYNGYDFILLYSSGNGSILLPLVAGISLYLVALATFRILHQEQQKQPTTSAHIYLFFGVAAIICTVGWLSFWVIFSMLFVLPLALLLSYISFQEEAEPLKVVSRTFSLVQGSYWRSVALASIMLLLGLTLFSLVDSVFIDLFFQFLNWLISAEQLVLDEWSVRINTFFLLCIANFIWVMLLLGFGLLYFSLREIKEAPGLKEKLSHIGQNNRLKGLERET
jgi:uncharacterized membrane protein SpoIIM required for sporulation